MAESRSVMLNLVGNNRTSRAFRGAADDADRLATRLDRTEKSSGKASRAMEALTGSAATLAAGLLTVGPAAQAATAAVVAGAGAMTAAFASAGAALGAFAVAAGPQLTKVGEAAELHAEAVEAAAEGGEKAAKASREYREALAELPPATRETAKALIGLKAEHKAWSDSLAGDTMPVFTRGLNIARGLLPKLTPLVKTGAAALNDFMKSAERGAKSKGFGAFLGRLNEAAKKSLPWLLRSVKNVAVGLGGMVDAFLPHSGDMAKGIERITERFAKWGQSLKDSESFRGFMQYVRDALPDLKIIGGNLVQVFLNLSSAMAPMSGISLEIVKGFTGILAALPPEVLRALATGFIGVSLAMRILNPLIATMNILLKLNPIGLVVLALAGLALGLYTAYKRSETFRRIVDKVWAGVKRAVSTAWQEHIRPALQGLARLFRRAYDTWQQWWPRLREILDEIIFFFKGTLLGTIEDIAAGFTKIGGKAEEATGKISGVGKGLNSTQEDGNRFLTWGTLFGSGIATAIAGPLAGVGTYITVTFWPQVKKNFREGFGELKRRAITFHKELPDVTRKGLSFTRRTVGDGIRGVRTTFFSGLPPIRRDWQSLWTWVDAFGRRLISRSRTAISNGLREMRNAFRNAVEGIRRAWAKLPDGVKRPINWVINVGYNRGIRRLWNKVMSWLKLPGGLQLGEVPALARGGTLDNPAPARPMMTNGPMAIVGEGRRAYPEYVIPTDPRYRARATALWAAAGGDLQMLAKGGVLGSVLGSVKKIAGKVTGIAEGGLSLLENPKGIWDRLAARMVPSASHLAVDRWGTAMSRVVPAMLDRAWGAANQIISTFKKWFGGDGGAVVQAARKMIGRGDDRGENNNWLTRAWGMPGAPWCAIFVSEAIKQGRAQRRYKGYPSAAVASYANAMRKVPSNQGRPGDLGAYRGAGPGGWGHINIIERRLGGSTYRTIGGNEGPRVKRGTRSNPTVLRPMARGGVLGVWQQENLDPADRRDPLLRTLRAGVFDSGGVLAPRSVTLAVNKTSRHEPIFPSWEAAAAYGRRDGPLVETVNVNHVPGYSTPQDVLRGLQHAERAARYHRRG